MSDRGEIDKQDFDMLAFRQGSLHAFRIFFLNNYAEFFSFARLLVSEKQIAGPVTTEAFFLLWAKHGDFDREMNIKAFLYVTIRDKSLQFLRSRQIHAGDRPLVVSDPAFAALFPEDIRQELLTYARQVAS